MGKAAKNERLKLKAAFYNNLAAGSAVGGVFIPLIGLYQNTPVSAVFSPLITFPPAWPQTKDYQFLMAAAVAFLMAFIFRHLADRIAARVED
jgi:hypothetical protein